MFKGLRAYVLFLNPIIGGFIYFYFNPCCQMMIIYVKVGHGRILRLPVAVIILIRDIPIRVNNSKTSKLLQAILFISNLFTATCFGSSCEPSSGLLSNLIQKNLSTAYNFSCIEVYRSDERSQSRNV